MLKIKKDKMQELEKFGFKKNMWDEYVFTDYGSIEMLYVQNDGCLYFELYRVPIYGAIVEDLLFKLFDLIKADMVEKVGEEE